LNGERAPDNWQSGEIVGLFPLALNRGKTEVCRIDRSNATSGTVAACLQWTKAGVSPRIGSMKTLRARLHSIEWLADGILGFDFRPMGEDQWPVGIAGSHIDLHLPGGLNRSYSLVNVPGESHRYAIAVNRAESGKGGSHYMHEQLRVGQVLSISEPRDSFPLMEAASHSVFVAGGIGVTPLWSMVQRLSQIGAPWTLYYSARTRESAAFIDQIESLASKAGGQVSLNFDSGMSERRLDLQAVIDSVAPDAHVYCCGPVPMLEAFERACVQRNPALVHREYFAAPTAAKTADIPDQQLTVTLARSGKTISVGAETSILDAILGSGVEVPYSCLSGICGACATKVLCGVPDHRDFVLSDAEKESGEAMIICCSRSKSADLTLDL
jgi:vanillate O-demethylase ferredoxin subunit